MKWRKRDSAPLKVLGRQTVVERPRLRRQRRQVGAPATEPVAVEGEGDVAAHVLQPLAGDPGGGVGEVGELLAEVLWMRRHRGQVDAEPLPGRLDRRAEVGLAAIAEVVVGGDAVEEIAKARGLRGGKRVLVRRALGH